MTLDFKYDSRDALKPYAAITLSFKFQKNISRRVSPKSGKVEFGQFTLLFRKGRLRNVPRILTHVYIH